jgi:hypothetical protein
VVLAPVVVAAVADLAAAASATATVEAADIRVNGASRVGKKSGVSRGSKSRQRLGNTDRSGAGNAGQAASAQ